jgi:molecular chaperone DnaJ
MAPSASKLDYYALLEVAHTATYDEIRISYRRLALKHHPDKDAISADATARMQNVRNQAISVLARGRRTDILA